MRSINWSYETEPEPHLDGRRHPLAARQGAGRHIRHQRHDVHARQPLGLRRLAPARPRRLGLRERAAILQAGRGARLPPRSLPRHRRPAPRQPRRLERTRSTMSFSRPATRWACRATTTSTARCRTAWAVRIFCVDLRAPREHRPRLHPAGARAHQPAPRASRPMSSGCSSRAGAAWAWPTPGRAAARDIARGGR